MCTVFHSYNADGRNFVGKNYDIKGDCPLAIFVNKRGVSKTAIIKPPDVPAKWQSKFGSVTFNPLGAEFPVCGMNEAGLVVEQTTLWNTLYPDKDSRAAIKELQWIQFMLDTCSSVDQVLDADKRVRIAQEQTRLQFVVADHGGKRALLEYILGECTVHLESQSADLVIANDMLATSKDYMAIHAGYGGTRQIAATAISLDRYAVTKDCLTKGFGPDNVVGCFDVLDRSRFDETRWQVAYDLLSSTLLFKAKQSEHPYEICLNVLAFEDKTRPDFMDAYIRREFKELTREDNLILTRNFFSDSYIATLMKVPERDLVMANAAILNYYSTYETHRN